MLVDIHREWKNARVRFDFFYTIADSRDAVMMDALVLAHAALTAGINLPREALAPEGIDGVERAIDALERRFMQVRQAFAETPSFQMLVKDDKQRIIDALFAVSFA